MADSDSPAFPSSSAEEDDEETIVIDRCSIRIKENPENISTKKSTIKESALAENMLSEVKRSSKDRRLSINETFVMNALEETENLLTVTSDNKVSN